MNTVSFMEELVKLGAISDDQARRSLDQLNQLEQAKPTVGQAARYGALGAGAGALTRTVSHTFEHGKLPSLRGLAGAAAAGAIGMGAVPLGRNALDRRAHVGQLKKYMQQEHAGQQYGKNAEPIGAPAKFEASGVAPTGPAGPASAV